MRNVALEIAEIKIKKIISHNENVFNISSSFSLVNYNNPGFK